MSEIIEVVGFFLAALIYVVFEELLPRSFAGCNQQVFTIEELREFDGRAGVCYTACNGIVFDVTKAPVEDPESIHHLFAGKDASVVLATMDFSNKRLLNSTPKFIHLSTRELKSLQHWEELYHKQFRSVGKMDYSVNCPFIGNTQIC